MSSNEARHSIRRKLDKALRMDSDLDAFTIDFFPDIHRRFTNGMDRVQKINILLTMAQHDQIAEYLETWQAKTMIHPMAPNKQINGILNNASNASMAATLLMPAPENVHIKSQGDAKFRYSKPLFAMAGITLFLGFLQYLIEKIRQQQNFNYSSFALLRLALL